MDFSTLLKRSDEKQQEKVYQLAEKFKH